ncbi:MAG: hypothetical protein PHV33_09255 [Elusimicrobiales bacterium]|nr:hypothetical protein [Elusimicrobiales bacterium]
MKLHKLHLLLLAALLALPAARVCAAPLEADAASAGELFDGEGRYTGTAAAAGSSAEGKARLLEALKTRLVIHDRGVPAEGERLNALLSRVLDTPTGRQLAVEFLQEGARAEISFDIIPDTQVLEINGKKTFWTSGGHAHTTMKPPQVHLNEAYLQAKPEDAPITLAHELFGHTLERKRAERYGVQDSYIFHQNEEANAGLVGWTVGAELGEKIDNGWAWIYMANPEDYHKRLKTNLAYYAGTLSTEEMKDPLPVYQERLAGTDALLLRLPVKKEQNEIWLRIIDHLVKLHKLVEETFKSLVEEIKGIIASIPGSEARLGEIRAYLKQLIEKCAGSSGQAWVASLKRESENEYFRERERVMDERAKALGTMMLGKTWESEQPPPRAGQVTWPQLKQLWKDEQASNCGWKP